MRNPDYTIDPAKDTHLFDECPDMHIHGPSESCQPEGHGSVFHIEGRLLCTQVRRHSGNWLEIGACRGISTRYMLHGMAPNYNLYSVDLRHQVRLQSSRPLLSQITADSATFTTPLEVVGAFIDGDHRYEAVVKDIGTALRCGATTLIFHDTSPIFTTKPVTGSDGSKARRAVLEHLLPDMWVISDVLTPCGMIIASRMNDE